jgi:hypothetical protein
MASTQCSAKNSLATPLFSLIEAQFQAAFRGFVQYAGLPPSASGIDQLHCWASTMIATWSANGLLDTMPRVGRYSEIAAFHILSHPDGQRNGLLRKIGLIWDALDIFVRCFTPIGTLLDRGVDLSLLSPGTSPAFDESGNGMFDVEAWKKCIMGSFNSSPAFVPTLAAPATIIVTAPLPVPAAETPAERIKHLREQLELGEEGAAEVLGWSKKKLANLRRARKIPTDLYRQTAKNCMVFYETQGLLRWHAERFTAPQSRRLTGKTIVGGR